MTSPSLPTAPAPTAAGRPPGPGPVVPPQGGPAAVDGGPRRRRRIGEVLVEQRLITEEQLQHCLSVQQQTLPGMPRRRLGTVVIDEGLASERQVAQALADALALELVDLGRTIIAPEAARLLPRAVSERNGLLIVERSGKRLIVAASDPTNIVALDDVRVYTGASDITVVVATESSIRDHLGRAWSLSEDASDVSLLFEDLEDDTDKDEPSLAPGETAPIVRMVDVVLSDAVRARASDVHVEPQSSEVRVRYRVDGLLRDVMTVPKAAGPALVSRLKIVSGLDIAERRRPQDGRARISVDGRQIEARISTLPTVHGEKVVVRLLPLAENVPLLTRTGLDERQLETLLTTLVAPQGLVLLTGPTGSGKTNTLYAAIRQVSTPDRNIVTLEDPVEVQVAGITQVQVHERSGLTFARGLRSVLRQDPDVVLVGEIRDSETAELALQASLTGHMVLSTLHTNDAVSAITRLIDMGVEPFLVASSLSLVVAQRLVRTPCAVCAASYTPSPRTLLLLGLTESDLAGCTPRRGRGCSECGGTGYKGRTGVYELLPITAGLRTALLKGADETAISAAARASGMTTLRASALAAARRGTTSFEEVLRVTHVDAAGTATCTTCARALGDDMACCPWCATPVDRGHCTSCAKVLEPEWRVCPWCRTPAVDRSVPGRALAPAVTPRLLVVEDDVSVCDFVRLALDGAAEVTSVGSAQEALNALANGTFDAALVDNGLPDLTGVELVRLLRRDARTAALPVVMVTGDDSREVELHARNAGADDYLTKPVEPMLLEERVLSLVARTTRAVG